MIDIFQDRAYVGALNLLVFFLISAWTVFFPARRFLPESVRRSPLRLAVASCVLFSIALYAGVKPEPPPPPPFGPTNSIVIPAARRAEPGRWRIRPSGTFEYVGPVAPAEGTR